MNPNFNTILFFQVAGLDLNKSTGAQKYVPPHLRSLQQAAGNQSDSPTENDNFYPTKQNGDRDRDRDQYYNNRSDNRDYNRLVTKSKYFYFTVLIFFQDEIKVCWMEKIR